MPSVTASRIAALDAMFDDVRICGDDDARGEDVVFCGGQLFADLFVDPTAMLMSRGLCSRLLEALFAREMCKPGQQQCGEVGGGIPPPPVRDLVSGAGPLALGTASPDWVLLARAGLRARPSDDRVPTSVSICPIAPPPRPAAA